jgi:hypothetical protein
MTLVKGVLLIGILIATTNSFSEGRLHPSIAHRKKSHRRNKTNSWKNSAVPVNNLPFIGNLQTPPSKQVDSTTNSSSIATTIATATVAAVVSTTTKELSFKAGNNQTLHTLENTLDNISPNPFTDLQQPTVTNQVEEVIENSTINKNNTSNMILEVINIAPYFRGRSKYSKKFVMVVTVYAALALACILMAAFLIRGIQKRNQRHMQYMLLTKRDLDYPVGGGGI